LYSLELQGHDLMNLHLADKVQNFSHTFSLGPTEGPMKTPGPFKKSTSPLVGLKTHVESHCFRWHFPPQHTSMTRIPTSTF